MKKRKFVLLGFGFLVSTIVITASRTVAATGIADVDNYVNSLPQRFNTKLEALTETQRKDIGRLINLYYYVPVQRELLDRAQNEAVIQTRDISSFYQKCSNVETINANDGEFLTRWKSFDQRLSQLYDEMSRGSFVNLNPANYSYFQQNTAEERLKGQNLFYLYSWLGGSFRYPNNNNNFVTSNDPYDLRNLNYQARLNALRRRRASLNNVCESISHILTQIRESHVNFLIFSRLPYIETRIQLTDIDLGLLFMNLMALDVNSADRVLDMTLNQVFEFIRKDINAVLAYQHLVEPRQRISISGLGEFPVFGGIVDPNFSYAGQLQQQSPKILLNGSQVAIVQSPLRRELCRSLRVLNAFNYQNDPPRFISNVVDTTWRQRINRLFEPSSSSRFPQRVIEEMNRILGVDNVLGAIHRGVFSVIRATHSSLPQTLSTYHQSINSLNLTCP